MLELVEDDAYWERISDAVDSRAEAKFINPGGGFIGEMAGPFIGIDGFRAGWREWLEPWAEYKVVPLEVIDAGDGRILFLVQTKGRLRAGGAELMLPTAAVWRLRDGIVIGVDQYLEQDEARAAVGLPSGG